MRTRFLVLVGGFLLLSACSMAPRRPEPVVAHPTPRPPVVACRDCGRILRVDMVSNVQPTAQGGAVLGGVVGGVLGGKPATPSGAQRKGVQVVTLRIALQMDDGRRLTLYQSELGQGLRAGSRIRVYNGRVWPSR